MPLVDSEKLLIFAVRYSFSQIHIFLSILPLFGLTTKKEPATLLERRANWFRSN